MLSMRSNAARWPWCTHVHARRCKGGSRSSSPPGKAAYFLSLAVSGAGQPLFNPTRCRAPAGKNRFWCSHITAVAPIGSRGGRARRAWA